LVLDRIELFLVVTNVYHFVADYGRQASLGAFILFWRDCIKTSGQSRVFPIIYMSLKLLEETQQVESLDLSPNAVLLQKKQPKKWSALLLGVLSAACFSISIVMAKYSLQKVSVPAVLLIESLASVVFLWGLLLARKEPIAYSRSLLKASFTGILEPGLSYSIGTMGLALTTASNASLLTSTEPLVTILLAAWLLRERLTLPILLTMGMTIAGMVLVSVPNLNEFGVSSLLGDGAVMVAICCAGLYAIASRRWVLRLDPLLLVTMQQTVALLFFVVVTLVMGGGRWDFAGLTPMAFLLIAVTGILGYAMSSWLQLRSLSLQTASMTALYLTLAPTFALIPAFLFLNERLSLVQGVGSCLTVGAIVMLTNLSENEVA
jgi:drug/metabolite transporter (DMT)-like permease